MKNRTKIVVGAALALALSGAGIGAAVASTPAPGTESASPTSTVETTEQSAPETPVGQEATSDGNDGGHQDPQGVDVNHEGGQNEK